MTPEQLERLRDACKVGFGFRPISYPDLRTLVNAYNEQANRIAKLERNAAAWKACAKRYAGRVRRGLREIFEALRGSESALWSNVDEATILLLGQDEAMPP